jgi:hypothetical protein
MKPVVPLHGDRDARSRASLRAVPGQPVVVMTRLRSHPGTPNCWEGAPAGGARHFSQPTVARGHGQDPILATRADTEIVAPCQRCVNQVPGSRCWRSRPRPAVTRTVPTTWRDPRRRALSRSPSPRATRLAWCPLSLSALGSLRGAHALCPHPRFAKRLATSNAETRSRPSSTRTRPAPSTVLPCSNLEPWRRSGKRKAQRRPATGRFSRGPVSPRGPYAATVLSDDPAPAPDGRDGRYEYNLLGGVALRNVVAREEWVGNPALPPAAARDRASGGASPALAVGGREHLPHARVDLAEDRVVATTTSS